MNSLELQSEKRSLKSKSDLVGAIHNSEIYELLELDTKTTRDESVAWNDFIEELEKLAGKADFGTAANKVSERVRDYGNEREESGYRNGFHVAMRLCMEGLSGGAR